MFGAFGRQRRNPPTESSAERAVQGEDEVSARMHALTVEAVRMLIGISRGHVGEIGVETARSLEYCLARMERYARDDWRLVRDFHPLLLDLRRRLR